MSKNVLLCVLSVSVSEGGREVKLIKVKEVGRRIRRGGTIREDIK